MASVAATDITVTDAILHLLDPEDGGFKPSLRALPEVQGAAGGFLAAHIAHGLSDSQIKGARFTAFSDGTAPVIVQQLITGADFVAGTQALAWGAYTLMEADKRIRPPGSLAVVRYLAAAAPGLPISPSSSSTKAASSAGPCAPTPRGPRSGILRRRLTSHQVPRNGCTRRPSPDRLSSGRLTAAPTCSWFWTAR